VSIKNILKPFFYVSIYLYIVKATNKRGVRRLERREEITREEEGRIKKGMDAVGGVSLHSALDRRDGSVFVVDLIPPLDEFLNVVFCKQSG
jgi:hypothetical protein